MFLLSCSWSNVDCCLPWDGSVVGHKRKVLDFIIGDASVDLVAAVQISILLFIYVMILEILSNCLKNICVEVAASSV